MKLFFFRIISILCFFLSGLSLSGQNTSPKLHLLEIPDSLHKGRFWVTAAAGTAIYSTASVILWNSWYKDYPISKFHFFDDRGEWQNMDKVGHFTQTWLEAYNGFNGARWTGMKRKNARWTAIALGMTLQLTVEVMDGFSEEWGFSWADIGANTLGAGFFLGQELLWEEQRFKLKISSNQPAYSSDPILSTDGNSVSSLKTRAEDLYGGTAAETFFKDYNAQTYWLSGNVHSFLKNKENSRFPKWLNIAFGYGANNMFGGYGNTWSEGDAVFVPDPIKYERYKEFYLSFDVDLSKLKVKSPVARFALGLLNWIKIPAPALEINTLGGVKFHPLIW
ncbi:YfiM family protein [Saprospiraceae bacterium]|jgi:uncharacterized protein YfiM (DUF2279 family)|nr:YfiM family protein [Bacteroidota bacterium]MDB4727235.1 YfiM family protein [Saprospiraceae bacterium]